MIALESPKALKMNKKLNCHSEFYSAPEILDALQKHKEKLKYEYLPHFTWSVGMCETEQELKDALNRFYENCEILNRKKNRNSFVSFESAIPAVIKEVYAELKKQNNKGKEVGDYNDNVRYIFTFKAM